MEIEIKTRSGQTVRRFIEAPFGSPERPIPDSALLNKFNCLVAPVLGAEKSRQLIDNVRHLEQIKNVRELAKLLLHRGYRAVITARDPLKIQDLTAGHEGRALAGC